MTRPEATPPARASRTAILVLGMHRSGTSALTRVLNLLGVALGDRLLPAHADNEAGFWEHREIVAVHDRLLAVLGSAWDDPAPLAPEALLGEAARPFREELARIVARDFGDAPLWGVKDPRLCRLVPLWRAILADAGCTLRCVLAVREPGAVAASLARRNGFPPEKSRLLWLEHVLRAERETRGIPRAFVGYDRLLADWRTEVCRVGAALDFPWAERLDAVGDAVDGFLNPGLRHHAAAVEADGAHPDRIADVHAALARACADDPRGLEGTLDGVREAMEVAGPLVLPWVGRLQEDVQHAREEIRRRDARLAALRGAPPAPAASAPPEPAPVPAAPGGTPGPLDREGTTIVRDPATVEGDPRVSIVIPLFGKVELTIACLESIAAHTPEGAYEVVLVDNGSPDETPRLFEQLEGNVRIVRNATNLGFATACNQGAALARTPNLLFLNNDIEAKPGWLEPLLDTLDADPAAGAVGAKLLFPDGTIQHAGVAVLQQPNGEIPLGAFHVHYGEDAAFPDANVAMEYQVVTGACLLVRREAFDAVGGFDVFFWNGCEDVDLCLKLRERGWRVVYRPESELVHHESMSGAERFSRVQANEKLLASRWFGRIEPDVVSDGAGNRTRTSAVAIRPWSPPAAADPAAGPAGGGAASPGLVSIVILARNELEHTRRCVESVEAHTPEPHELLLVDNGSSDDTREWMGDLARRNEHVRVIANDENRGFGGGNNQALALARGRFLVLLNNDTLVTEGWLGRLATVLDEHPDCGIVGPMTNRASGPQVIADVPYGGPESLERFAEQVAREWAGRSEPAWRLAGFCWLMRREVVDAIGGFDPRFGLGNCEDDDYCLRAAQAGWRTRIARDAFVHHVGSRTFAAEGIDYGATLAENFERLKAKWGMASAARLEDGYPFLELARGPRQPAIPLPDPRADHVAALGGRMLEPIARAHGPAVVPDAAPSRADRTRRLRVGVGSTRPPIPEVAELFRRHGHAGAIPVWSVPGHLAHQLEEDGLVLLLGPDVLLTDDALSRLVRIATAHPRLAAVGPASNAAPAPQRAKAAYVDRGKGLRRFAQRRARRHGDAWEPVPYLGAFCLLLRAEVVRAAGGLPTGETIADALWNLWDRLAKAGAPIAMAPGAWVHHVRLDAEEGADYDARAEATVPADAPAGEAAPQGAGTRG